MLDFTADWREMGYGLAPVHQVVIKGILRKAGFGEDVAAPKSWNKSLCPA